MKQWMKKIAVMLITIMTLGMYVPVSLTAETNEDKESYDTDSKVDESIQTTVVEEPPSSIEEELPASVMMEKLTEKVKEQAMLKMGPRIAERIGGEFTAVILPKIEEIMQTVMLDENGEPISYYGITEQPAKGYGERIFHIYDYHNEETVAKFHVRRDHRPLDGYWFNFHYHLKDDDFEKHYEVGELFWDKNTPPKWMA